MAKSQQTVQGFLWNYSKQAPGQRLWFSAGEVWIKPTLYTKKFEKSDGFLYLLGNLPCYPHPPPTPKFLIIVVIII